MKTPRNSPSNSVIEPGVRFRRWIESYFANLFQMSAKSAAWNRITFAALLALVSLWALRVYLTWATWGNLSIDCGREMYVPAVLAQGKTLYKDVWFGYMPAAPYINATLYRMFGISLTTLYWAGCLSALTCGVLLFLTGKRLGSWIAGWGAGAVVLFQSFHAWHFCFPLPYSFSSVYGCVSACLFLYLLIRIWDAGSRLWLWAAGLLAGIALCLKLEFGVACFAALGVALGLRVLNKKSLPFFVRDLAAISPGLILVFVVLVWMLSLGGFAFITQENLAGTWPFDYFMKTYGKLWLQRSGLALDGESLRAAAVRGLFSLGAWTEIFLLLLWKRRDLKSHLVRIAVFLCLLPYIALSLHWRLFNTLGAVFFPRDMVLYVSLAGALGLTFGWAHRKERGFAILLLMLFAGLLGSRILLRNTPGGYAIYYNGPAILGFLLLVRALFPEVKDTKPILRRPETLLCLACVGVAAFYSLDYLADPSDLVPLKTDRGTIKVARQVAANYTAGIRLMKESARKGEYVLSVPEDVSLYFLSEADCPTRLYYFQPGVISPGKITEEVMQQLREKNVRYLLWSNRDYSDYGAPKFGTDYAQDLGDYFRSHYHKVGLIAPDSFLDWQTMFTLWEKNEPPTTR